MNKKEIQNRVLKNGEPLDLELFTWDERTKTFVTNIDGLMLDFKCIDGVTFKTGYGCIFKTGFHCTFDTGGECTFKTGSWCTFKTGSWCTFKTGSYCIFQTGGECMFETEHECTFETGSECIFKTESHCTFKTGIDCVVVRRDVYEIIQLVEDQKIKLNGYSIKGYKIIPDKHTIVIDGKEIELSGESYKSLKESLCQK